MMKKKGENQSSLKEHNQRLILNCLKGQAWSCSDLARMTDLSYTGVVTLVEELTSKGIVVKEDAEVVSMGRRPILVKIAPRRHLVCVINLAGEVMLKLYDLSDEELHSHVFAFSEVITQENFRQLIAYLKEVLQNEFSNGLLEAICIAAPGKINKNTGDFVFAPFIENYRETNLVKLFGDEFGVPVVIKNNLRFQLLAEKAYGKYKDQICDTLFVQLGGQGFGCALFLDNKLYEGAYGLNGEIGLFITDYRMSKLSYANVSECRFFQQNVSNTAFVRAAEYALAQGEKSMLSELDTVTYHDIARGYLADDPLCCSIINESARMTADVIKSLSEVLDFGNVIVSRETMVYGQKYLDTVSAYLNSQLRAYHIDILMSTFGKSGTLLGAKVTALDVAIRCLASR